MKLESYIVPSSADLLSFTNHKINVYGNITLPINFAGLEKKVEFIVSDFTNQGYEFLIGMDFLCENKIGLCMASKTVHRVIALMVLPISYIIPGSYPKNVKSK